MSVAGNEPQLEETEHALLVPMGAFAQELGLIEALRRVPFPMKTVRHRPGDKLATVLIHLLAGGMHINELATAPQPLLRDSAVAHAWDQERFASASGVSALLAAATEESVVALKQELEGVLGEDRHQQLTALSRSWLVVDCDLTGLVVSDQARTYEGAESGYMGELGHVGKGYQFARAQVEGPHERILLGGFLHPGHTVSLACTEELVHLVEERLGRPWRRTDLVEQRLEAAEQQLAKIEASLARLRPGQTGERLRPRRARLRAQIVALQTRLAVMQADNQLNRAPVRIMLRLDGGFGSSTTIAWLMEQGYSVVTCGHNQQLTAKLRIEDGLHWERLSKNSHIAESRCTQLGDCPYPLRLFLCRQEANRFRHERHFVLIATPDLTPKDWSIRRVGEFYLGRADMEAGIKESKAIFASRHLPTRKRAGIALYQELVLCAQNLLRCFRRRVLAQTPLAHLGSKALVHSAARCRALVLHEGTQLVLQFAASSRWAGQILTLAPTITYQQWFPFFEAAREYGP